MSVHLRDVVPGQDRLPPRSHRSHSRRRRLIAFAALGLLLLSCGEPVEQTVTLAFDESGTFVTITAVTKLNKAKPGTPEARLVDDTRSALLAGHDEWAFRFQNADPKTERTVFEKADHELVSAEHS